VNVTVPSAYHAIAKATAHWKALVAAEGTVATRTLAARADALREEKAKEVHVTGKSAYLKKGS